MKTLAFLLIFISSASAEVIWNPLPPEAYRFGEKYPEAQHLLFAFDYGHALVYEKLLANRGKITNPYKFEKELLTQILAILKNPPHVKVEESDIAPHYVFTFPLTLTLFDWSHMLHQFVLDVLATSTDRGDGMYERINSLYEDYKANPSVRITDECKSMFFMDGHYFSKAFRRTYPSFNLLIWSYHWFQIKFYDDLMEQDQAKRDTLVAKTIAAFWNLVSDLPDSADFDMMPETFKEAPKFSKRFPKIAASFDNNHMLHDIVSDILVSDKVLIENIRFEGLRVARMAMNPDAFKATACPVVP